MRTISITDISNHQDWYINQLCFQPEFRDPNVIPNVFLAFNSSRVDDLEEHQELCKMLLHLLPEDFLTPILEADVGEQSVAAGRQNFFTALTTSVSLSS